MNILITGSEGILGKVVSEALKEHNLVLLDKKAKNPIDLLKDYISDYFRGIETTIHLAAYPRPWISLEQAQENFLVGWNVLEECRKNNVKRFINASSLNVYDFDNIWRKGLKITSQTPVMPNTKKEWRGGGTGEIFYARAKVALETLAYGYYQTEGISVLNLRLGGVNKENKPPLYGIDECEPFEEAGWLSHEDLSEIIKRAIYFNGYASIPVTSANSGNFVDLKPLEKALGYFPKSNSSTFRK